MRYTVGIDFGTHQTKVCIEDSLNRRVPIYEFLEFVQPDGSTSVLFPSIVQVNEDNSLSYGFVDRSRCKTIQDNNVAAPQLILPEKPTLTLPKEPRYQKVPKEPIRSSGNLKGDWASAIQSLVQAICPKVDVEYQKWKDKKKKIERSNEALRLVWKHNCELAESAYNLEYEKWKKDIEEAQSKYKETITHWENSIKKEQLYFRYFKQASFHSYVWTQSIAPETLSIWYLTYVYFCICKRIGSDFVVQIGAPMGASKNLSMQQRNVAKRIWSSACKLAAFYETKEKFLDAKLDDLKSITEDCICSDGRVTVIPEASAGLLSIRDRIGQGMFLLVDIGGGTTDVGMCSVYKNQNEENILGIHKIYSFNKGLNFVFEEYQKTHSELSLIDIQDLFGQNKDKSKFAHAISTYRRELYLYLKHLVNEIIRTFASRYSWHRLNTETALFPAIDRKPIYLCGGGSVFADMRNFSTTDLHFSDKRHINRSLLRIENLANNNTIKDSIFPILATAYGLSKQVNIEEELDEKPLEKYFDHLPKRITTNAIVKTQDNDYSLAIACC